MWNMTIQKHFWNIDQFFYLIEDTENGVWTIIDNSTNGEPTAATVP